MIAMVQVIGLCAEWLGMWGTQGSIHAAQCAWMVCVLTSMQLVSHGLDGRAHERYQKNMALFTLLWACSSHVLGDWAALFPIICLKEVGRP